MSALWLTGCSKDDEDEKLYSESFTTLTSNATTAVGNFDVTLVSSNEVDADGNYVWTWKVEQIEVGGPGNRGLSHISFIKQECLDIDHIVSACWSTDGNNWTCEEEPEFKNDPSTSDCAHGADALKIDEGDGVVNYYKIVVNKKFCESVVDMVLKVGPDCVIGGVMGIGCDECDDEPCYDYQEETAWSDGPRYTQRGNWATYTEAEEDSDVTLYAGRTNEAGNVHFSGITNGKITLTITLNADWYLQDGDESVKIQGYDNAPSGNPAPGRFTTYKGNSLIVEVDAYDFYGIHLDVKKKVEVSCP